MSASQTAVEIELHAIQQVDSPFRNEDKTSSHCRAVVDLGVAETDDRASPVAMTSLEPVAPGRLHSMGIMVTLASVTFLHIFNSGMLVVALTTIASEVNLAENLLFWPASVYSLALSCFLLPLGAIADIVGNRPVFLTGSLLYTVFTLAVSLARTGDQLIAFRTLQGISMAFCMPPAVSTITSTFPTGRTRNIAFAVFGGGNPLGFALALVLGGVFVQVSSWRVGYWLSTSVNAASMVLAWFVLPGRNDDQEEEERGRGRLFLPGRDLRRRLVHDLDWVGVASIATCLALLSYLFAEITHGASIMKRPYAIAMLIIAVLLIPVFVFWEARQESLGRPAVLPNSLWRRREFATVCLSVFLTWAWFTAFSYWVTLYFQVSQQLSPIETAVRFLPLVVVGLCINVVAAMTMDKVSAGVLCVIGGVFSAIGPLLFALQDLSWIYWVSAFPALVLSIISTDLLFNISNLVITTNFPGKSQALAGGVFSTVAQLGNSIGLAVTAMIAAAVQNTAGGHKMATTSGGLTYDYSVLQGYRSGFWTCFAAAVVSTLISSIGLRKAGKVGKKKEL